MGCHVRVPCHVAKRFSEPVWGGQPQFSNRNPKSKFITAMHSLLSDTSWPFSWPVCKTLTKILCRKVFIIQLKSTVQLIPSSSITSLKKCIYVLSNFIVYLGFAYFLKRRRIFLELNSQGLHPVSKREEKNQSWYYWKRGTWEFTVLRY